MAIEHTSNKRIATITAVSILAHTLHKTREQVVRLLLQQNDDTWDAMTPIIDEMIESGDVEEDDWIDEDDVRAFC